MWIETRNVALKVFAVATESEAILRDVFRDFEVIMKLTGRSGEWNAHIITLISRDGHGANHEQSSRGEDGEELHACGQKEVLTDAWEERFELKRSTEVWLKKFPIWLWARRAPLYNFTKIVLDIKIREHLPSHDKVKCSIGEEKAINM
ncbi:uncharacterized protein CIMG_08104 [Coccidioides immitis RS]|uniref:Uncharacterized protein n=1 Tax=Coccidioides immitis (strain RS) TaxID=246410 RepID=A0A0E1RVA0_COCIM|nr:uncharacterized protein CIMG_08104 [Coccidioides immitis RS]EAS29358.2 hypothetical protein CIMG_08104 [Coccidioides immitis RS]